MTTMLRVDHAGSGAQDDATEVLATGWRGVCLVDSLTVPKACVSFLPTRYPIESADLESFAD